MTPIWLTYLATGSKHFSLLTYKHTTSEVVVHHGNVVDLLPFLEQHLPAYITQALYHTGSSQLAEIPTYVTVRKGKEGDFLTELVAAYCRCQETNHLDLPKYTGTPKRLIVGNTLIARACSGPLCRTIPLRPVIGFQREGDTSCTRCKEFRLAVPTSREDRRIR